MIMVAAVLLHRDKTGSNQFGKVAAGGLRGNSRARRQLLCGKARRSINASSMLARAGSPTREPISATLTI